MFHLAELFRGLRTTTKAVQQFPVAPFRVRVRQLGLLEQLTDYFPQDVTDGVVALVGGEDGCIEEGLQGSVGTVGRSGSSLLRSARIQLRKTLVNDLDFF